MYVRPETNSAAWGGKSDDLDVLISRMLTQERTNSIYFDANKWALQGNEGGKNEVIFLGANICQGCLD